MTQAAPWREDKRMKPLRLHSDSIALPSFHASRSTVRDRTVPIRPGTSKTDHRVLMSIRVRTANLTEVRRLLHRVLGPALDIYTAVIDNKTGQACLQLELARACVSDAMSSIMCVLPEAEFGTIRRSARPPASRAPTTRTRATD
ncbi:hypothetical protein QZM22_21545 [Burkholderia oklahomensis]|uniref:hypothetical protein n=1 Tax=Burkholderia oklahomensis TaxID=342113 RepID=UPI00264F5B5E|nr:hypothetical protein [Burkholderia oklahomensis]MDN7675035.1 hypothetical protein [Burkholderia oklahomensis]